MIIESLSLCNFRVFKGVNNIQLAPRKTDNSNQKSTVLFGGLNGAGKTSILTAVRLALYGRAAFGFSMTADEYQQQLASLIHKGTGVSQQEAFIELVFTYSAKGEQQEYKIIRSWQRGKKDTLSLFRNDVPVDNLTYEQCQAFLNELIPTGIADLFFFDGEKIAELAEDKSGNVLQTAVRRLLGIDVIERLKNDLNIFLKPHQSQAMPETVKEQIVKLEAQRKGLENEADISVNLADELQGIIDTLNADIASLNTTIMNLGGAWAKTKKQEEENVDKLTIEKKTLESSIRKELEGALPFAFATKTLNNLIKTLDNEAQTKQKQAFTNELAHYINDIENQLSVNTEAAAIAKTAIADTFANYQNTVDSSPIALDLSERERAQVNHQIEVAAPAAFTRFNDAQKRLSEVTNQLDNAAINIQRAPDEDRVAALLEDLNRLHERKTVTINERSTTLELAKKQLLQAIDLTQKIQALHDKYKTATNVSDAVTNALSTNALLSDFANDLTNLKVQQLQTEFIKSYQKLARKDDVNISAQINTETFDVELIDEHNNTINRKELSAGEKQIYAIAILEALGRTSGRKLPIIIDTPLGRLDSKHRDKLIELYLPDASHQVIILSTDTEVDENYFNHGRFGESISHAYEIKFDGDAKASKLQPGYFWQKESISEAL